MKRIIFSLLFTFALFATISAQEESEHLTFKGVPIDGTLNEYVEKMKQAGFTYLGSENGTAILQGDFAGFKGCTIGVVTLESTNKVNTIGVIFPEQNDWASLENDYMHLKSMLTEKYGKPSDCVEVFQGYATPQTDSDKLHELQMDRCTWYTTYSVEKGDIQLSIQSQNVMNCYVLLRYFDKINTNAVREQAMDDL